MRYPSLVNALKRRVQLTSLSRIINVTRPTETHLRYVRGETLCGLDDVDPQQMDRDHED